MHAYNRFPGLLRPLIFLSGSILAAHHAAAADDPDAVFELASFNVHGDSGPFIDTPLVANQAIISGTEIEMINAANPEDTLKYGFCLRKNLDDGKCKPSYNNHTTTYTWAMIWGGAQWLVLAQALAAHHPAADAVANQDDMATYWFAEEQVVEGGNGIKFFRSHFHIRRHVFEAFVGNPAAMLLHHFQCFNAGSFSYRHDTDRFFNFFF